MIQDLKLSNKKYPTNSKHKTMFLGHQKALPWEN